MHLLVRRNVRGVFSPEFGPRNGAHGGAPTEMVGEEERIYQVSLGLGRNREAWEWVVKRRIFHPFFEFSGGISCPPSDCWSPSRWATYSNKLCNNPVAVDALLCTGTRYSILHGRGLLALPPKSIHLWRGTSRKKVALTCTMC